MDDFETIKASFERCDDSGVFSDTFYDIFMSKSDDIKSLFANTDFTKQKKLLRATVKVLVSKNYEDANTKKILEDIGRTHNRAGYNIKPRYYALWLDSLCETVARLDAEYSDELEALWRKQLQTSIDFIIEKY
jgi:hemoglobin-like flavoprotein